MSTQEERPDEGLMRLAAPAATSQDSPENPGHPRCRTANRTAMKQEPSSAQTSPEWLRRRGARPAFRSPKIVCLFPVLLASPWLAPAAEVKRPNFLFIVADDQSPLDLRIYNRDSTLETPHLDRLAAQGTVIDGAYHMGAFQGAVCTPSRHMIMSGRTVWHLPISPGARS
jgi:hypothetical protein